MTWATVLWQAMPWTLLASVVLWYLRDRRKDRAAAEVAEQTVDADVAIKEADVAIKDIGVQDARLLYAVRAFDAERVSLQRQIEDRDRQLARKDLELDHAQTVIARLRVQVEDLQGRLDDALRDLNSVRQELANFAEQHDGGTAPA